MEKTKEDMELERFFAAERAESAGPSADLVAAILADGEELQPVVRGLPRSKASPSWFRFRNLLGGWGTASALSACLVLGISVGYAAPESLSTFTNSLLDTAGINQSVSENSLLDDVMAGG